MPDLNIILDNIYQLSDAEARKIMHTALCNMRDSGEDMTPDDIAHYLNAAADGKLG
jgi:hypothetical protein